MSDEFLPRIASFCRPGTVIDVGANLGRYSRVMVRAPQVSVVAFEPFIGTFLIMYQTMAEDSGGKPPRNFLAYNAALGAGFTAATMMMPIVGDVLDHEAASLVKDFDRLAADMGASHVRTLHHRVLVAPLDSFQFDPVTFIKIDVEGAELDVLRGAEQTLRRSRPIILIEIEERHQKGSTTAVPAHLDALGYRGFFHLNGGIVGFERFDRATMHVAPALPMQPEGFSDPYVNEFLFIHRDDAWAFRQIAGISSL